VNFKGSGSQANPIKEKGARTDALLQDSTIVEPNLGLEDFPQNPTSSSLEMPDCQSSPAKKIV
jgi:hypothetical protein